MRESILNNKDVPQAPRGRFAALLSPALALALAGCGAESEKKTDVEQVVPNLPPASVPETKSKEATEVIKGEMSEEMRRTLETRRKAVALAETLEAYDDKTITFTADGRIDVSLRPGFLRFHKTIPNAGNTETVYVLEDGSVNKEETPLNKLDGVLDRCFTYVVEENGTCLKIAKPDEITCDQAGLRAKWPILVSQALGYAAAAKNIQLKGVATDGSPSASTTTPAPVPTRLTAPVINPAILSSSSTSGSTDVSSQADADSTSGSSSQADTEE